jgi:hypothetical protein
VPIEVLAIEDGAGTPCQCVCMGPMLYGKHLFYYCGPPVFDALDHLGEEIEAHKYLYCDVGPRYMDNYKSDKEGNLSLCKYCWASSNFQGVYESWSMAM